MACSRVVSSTRGRRSDRTSLTSCALAFGIVGSLLCAQEAHAGKATTGNWIGPFSMGHTPANPYTEARATHMTILRRQTTYGDSTLVVHWHDRSKVRAWTYSYGADGTFLADTTNTARARILSDPVHNVFCSGHVNLLDGRLLVVGGTAPNTGGELGTTEVVTLDPNQPNLWTWLCRVKPSRWRSPDWTSEAISSAW